MRLPSLITLMPSVRNLAVACLLLAVAPAGHGATCTWNGGSGDWHDAAKWSCGTVPTAADDVMLNLVGGTVTLNAPAPARSLVITLFGTIGGSGAFNVSDTTSITGQFGAANVTTNGSRLPNLAVSTVGGGLLTLTDPALTGDSLANLAMTRQLGDNGVLMLDTGPRSVGNLTLQNGSLQLRAPLTVTGSMTWAGGSVGSTTQQPLIIGPAAIVNINNGGQLSTAMINNGTINSSGIQALIATATASLTNNGTYDVRLTSPTAANSFDAGLMFGGSSMDFVNYGSLLFNHSGTLSFATRTDFNNHGTVQFNSGTVRMSSSTYRQFAGLSRFNGGNLAGAGKCCSLDATQVYLYGGVLSGGGNPLYDIVGGIENDGGVVLLDSTLKVTNFYSQTARGSLAVTINGTAAGTDFGTMSIVKRPGVTSNGSISLAGNLIVDRGTTFTPRSGDRFTILTAEGNVVGSTSGGSGSMYPAFAAFAGLGQVTIAEPTAALLLQAKADQPSTMRNGSNGYTLKMVNPTTATIHVSSPQVTIPIDFAYQTGSSTGLTSTEPFSSDNAVAGTRSLSWNLPASVAIPPGGRQTLHFGVVVGANARIALYRINAQLSIPSTLAFNQLAPVDIRASSALSSTTISVTGGSTQRQNGSDNILLMRSAISTSSINIRTRISCPAELVPCGNLRTVFLGQAVGGRYVNVRQLTLDPDQSEPATAVAARPASSISRRASAPGSPAVLRSGPDYGFWKGQIPGSGSIPGVPQKIYPDWDNHRPCIAFNGDGNGLYPVNCVGGDGNSGGGGGGGGDDIGTPQLYDPSGIITDATTGLPIIGATVSLFRQVPGLPDTPALTRQCRTIDTRGGSNWTGTAADTGIFEQPGFAPPQMSPDLNPQVTGADGRYGWNVVTGCWYVKVSAPGYAGRISALVGVPPEVTDLHLALQPAGPVNLTRVLSRKTHGAAGPFDLVIDHSIAIGGALTIEPRAIGSGHQIVFQFDGPVTGVGATVVTDAASNPVGSASTQSSGNEVIVTLVNVPDRQRRRVELTSVNGTLDVAAAVGFLAGDANGSGAINAADVSAVRARSGQITDESNYRHDINATGRISAADIAASRVRAALALTLP